MRKRTSNYEVLEEQAGRQVLNKVDSRTVFRLFYEGRKITQLLEPVLMQNRLYWSRPSSGLIVGMVVEVQIEVAPKAKQPNSSLPFVGSSTMAGIIKKDERNRIYIDLE